MLSKAWFILLTPTSRRQSAAQILTHTNIGPVHTPAFAADDLSLRSIRLVGVSIRRAQFSWTQATSRRQSLAILQSQAITHGLISALSLPRYVIWGRSRLQQIVMVEMNAPCCSNGPTRHRITSRISGIMRIYLGNSHSPQVPIISPTGCILVFFSLREYQPHVKPY